MLNQHNGFSGIAIAIVALVAIGFVALLLSTAMQAGGLVFVAAIIGLIAIAALTAWLVSFFVRQYVTWTETHVKSREVQNNFLLNVLRVGYLPDGRGGFKPIQPQIAAPASKPKEVAPADPRKQLLIELCLLTIRTDKFGKNEYGPTSRRLMTADDAQDIGKARGGTFADRNNWDKASTYAQECYLVYEKRGGKEQGMMVDRQRAGGDTVADLMSVLMRNPILDGAINALPGIDR